MQEKHINLCNKLLYYVMAPCLLLYFFLIDTGVIKCTITGLVIFSAIIICGVAIPMIYKKNNKNYKFVINNSYGKIMAVLVLFELSFNLYK
ncbi:MAG: hypothetical protein E7208_01770 [Clostridium butyricum]|nr:hypothetical protein [Clostridium butyricum]